MRTRLSLLLPLLLAACDDGTDGADPGPMDNGVLDIDMAPMEEDEGMPPVNLDMGMTDDAEVVEEDADVGDVFLRDYELPDAAPSVCMDEPPFTAQPPIDLGARCRQGGPLRIRDIRDSRCPDWERLPTSNPGRQVTLEQAVVTGVYGTDFTVQDPDGGAYSSLFVYNPGEFALPADLQPGSVVRLQGQVIEFFTLTEFVINEDSIEVFGQGPVPEPILVTDPQRVATGGDLAEALESVLIEVRDVRVADTAPDCPRDFGMFVVSGGLRIDDKNDFDYEAARGDYASSIIGTLHYSFNETKLFPRGPADVDMTHCGGIPDKCETSECQVEPDAVESGRVVISEIQSNPRGEDAQREWVEILNPGGGRVDLTGWTIEDCTGRGVNLSGNLNNNERHVVARSQNREINGGVRADGGMGELFLPNSYGSVLLFDANHVLVDQVRYEPDAPWPSRRPGESLELVNPQADNNDGSNWRAGSDNYGDGGSGSPGR